MKKKFVYTLAYLLMIVMMLSNIMAISKNKANVKNERLVANSFGLSSIEIKPNGEIEKIKNPKPNKVGETEIISASLEISENAITGDKYTCKIQTKALDLSSAKVTLVFTVEGRRQTFEPTIMNRKDSLEFDIEVSQITLKPGSSAIIYIEATRLLPSGELKFVLEDYKHKGFSNAQVPIKSYRIKKQTGTGVELAKGLPSMSAKDTVYIIYDKDSNELMRYVVQNGLVLGLAKKDSTMIVGLVFDFDKKVYVNALTHKTLLTKDEVLKIFEDLDFSFLKLPEESKWLSMQNITIIEKTSAI